MEVAGDAHPWLGPHPRQDVRQPNNQTLLEKTIWAQNTNSMHVAISFSLKLSIKNNFMFSLKPINFYSLRYFVASAAGSGDDRHLYSIDFTEKDEFLSTDSNSNRKVRLKNILSKT